MKNLVDMNIGQLVLLVLILFLSLFSTCNSCQTKTLLKQHISENHDNDSLMLDKFNNIYTKAQTDVINDINNRELSKNILYDWNAVVRTAVRPDDRMNEYDTDIGNLRKYLKKLELEGK